MSGQPGSIGASPCDESGIESDLPPFRRGSYGCDLRQHAKRRMSGSNGRILLSRDEVDRMVLMKMDLDRYEAQLIPDLQQRVFDVTRALKAMIAAADDVSVANRDEALAAARRVLASLNPPTK